MKFPKTASDIITLVHNITQVITWTIVLYNQFYGGIFNNKFDQYWISDSTFRYWLELAQTLQLLDILLSLLGMTKNHLGTVIIQISVRLMVLYMVFPLVQKGHFSIYLATIAWSWTEVSRFTYYILK